MKKPLFVKICGVTSERDACMAADAGADAIGLNFYPKSPRYVSPAKARRIVEALPPFVWAIGIFVNETADTLYRVAEKARLDAVQLHGNERPTLANGLHLRTLKALHVGTAGVERLAARFHVDALVLDAAQPGFGGGGITFDWKYAHALARKRPLLLAGGLTPANVAEAVNAVHPFGVDVASGVEKSPGVKDSKKVRAFIQAARRAQ